MGKKSSKENVLLDSLSVMYAAVLLLHMERNGLLEKTTIQDYVVPISTASGKASSQAIANLEKKIINAVKIMSSSKKAETFMREKSFAIVDAFFKTGLHKEGVVPPLLFACMLFAWFVEKNKKPPALMPYLSKAETYDEVFLSTEEVSDQVNWGKHMDAAMSTLSGL